MYEIPKADPFDYRVPLRKNEASWRAAYVAGASTVGAATYACFNQLRHLPPLARPWGMVAHIVAFGYLGYHLYNVGEGAKVALHDRFKNSAQAPSFLLKEMTATQVANEQRVELGARLIAATQRLAEIESQEAADAHRALRERLESGDLSVDELRSMEKAQFEAQRARSVALCEADEAAARASAVSVEYDRLVLEARDNGTLASVWTDKAARAKLEADLKAEAARNVKLA